MPDEYPNPRSLKSLHVISGAEKLQQLREAFAHSPPAPKAPGQTTLIDRALDSAKTPQQKAITERVIEVLRGMYDPEIPVNIYDLGLIYEINVDADTSAVHVKMTLTAPGCPVAGSLPAEVQRRAEAIAGVSDAVVELVWDPPWTKDRMSEAALLELGLL